MRKLWSRFAGGDEFEDTLRRNRPHPREEFLQALEARVEADARRARGRSARLVFAGAFVAVSVAALASVGGISYAANATESAVKAVKRIVAPKALTKRAQPAVGINLSSGGDQYRPGFGFGDPNHNHTGPPGITRRGGNLAPPLRERPAGTGPAGIVATAFTLDEQALLYIAVKDPDGNFLLLTQKSKRGGSVVGSGLTGQCCAKFIRYRALVPRSIPLQLRIPSNLTTKPGRYQIRIVGFDPDGNRTETDIPFTVAA